MTAPTRDVQDNTRLGQEPSRGLGEPDASLPKWTSGPWDVYAHPITSADDAKRELCEQVDQTDPLAAHLYLINAGGKCPALTGCGPTSEANAHLIAAAPDFAEAAVPLVAEIEHYPPSMGEDDDEIVAVRLGDLRRLREALALARGVSQ